MRSAFSVWAISTPGYRNSVDHSARKGNTILITGKYPNPKVRLTVFKDRIFKKKYSILLAIERKKIQKKGR